MRFLSILISLQVATIVKALLPTKLSLIRLTSALRSSGSDILARPSDEDSPEFRDYLRNLMKMQANRARSGHAAPSSGSSDAYFAKLTRLKVEKKALRDAGLPDDLLDTGYTQDDYDSAIYEAQEPLVSATVLSGDAAIASRQKKSNAKTRSLTAEEIIMRDNAERTVEAARERQMALPPSERATREIAVDPRVRASNLDPSPEIDIIDKVLAGRSLINLKPKTGPKIEAMTGYAEAKGNQQQQKSAPVRSTAPVPVVKSVPVRSEVPVPVAAAVAKAAPVVSAVPLRPLPPKQAPPPPKPVARVVATPVPAPVVAPAAPAKVSTVDVQLKSDELELMAKSLQMLVKHRGGGPFGAGRLQTVKEIANLEISLVNTVEMLTRVDGKAASSSVVVPVKQASAPAPVAVRQAPIAVKEIKVAAPPPVPVRAVAPAPAPVGVAVAVATPVQARAVQTESRVQEDAAPITIAQGLDQFLLAPQLRSEEELAGLRDGLIQCLYMIQTEISSRPIIDQPTEVQMQEQAATDENEAVERIMRINAPAMSASEQGQGQGQGQRVEKVEETATEIPVEQEVKLALGLLLKHRGGPGFGHGRLVGKELDLMAAKLRSVSQRLVAEAVNEL